MRSLLRLHDKLLSVDDILDEQLRVATHLQKEWDRNVDVYVQQEEDEYNLYREVA